MTVGKACTRIVVTAHPEETVQAVARRMAQHDVGTLVVVESCCISKALATRVGSPGWRLT